MQYTFEQYLECRQLADILVENEIDAEALCDKILTLVVENHTLNTDVLSEGLWGNIAQVGSGWGRVAGAAGGYVGNAFRNVAGGAANGVSGAYNGVANQLGNVKDAVAGGIQNATQGVADIYHQGAQDRKIQQAQKVILNLQGQLTGLGYPEQMVKNALLPLFKMSGVYRTMNQAKGFRLGPTEPADPSQNTVQAPPVVGSPPPAPPRRTSAV